MTRDEEHIEQYTFWLWQYSKRNAYIVTTCSEFLSTLALLPCSKLFQQDIELQQELAKCRAVNSQRINRITIREPNSEESLHIESAIRMARELRRVQFRCEDIVMNSSSPMDMINRIVRELPPSDSAPKVLNPCMDDAVFCYGEFNEYTNCRDISDDYFGTHLFAIDINLPDELIHSLISFKICVERCLCSVRQPIGFINFSICHDQECPSFQRCEDVRQKAISAYKKHILDAKISSFKSASSASRVVGLWLWDHVQANGGDKVRGRVAAAIRDMKSSLGDTTIEALGFAISEENVFRGFYRKTKDCINALEVLPFK